MASTEMVPPSIPVGAEITLFNKIPTLVSKLNQAELNLLVSLLPVISKSSPILVKSIRRAHNYPYLSPLAGCRSVLAASFTTLTV